MKKVLLVVGFVFLVSGCMEGSNPKMKKILTQLDEKRIEEKKFISSKTNIIESNENYIVIENTSAKIESLFGEDFDINPKFSEIAINECKKYNKKFYGDENVLVLSQHKGKFFCITKEEELVLQVRDYENFSNGVLCKEPTDEVCVTIKNDLKNFRLELKELRSNKKVVQSIDSQKKKKETCSAYGFEVGSEPFGQCIFKLMELDLEYAKLENERLKLEAQAEQAKLNNQTALAQSLASQAQAANQDKALRIQQFGLAMQGIANSFQTPQPSLTPKITCNRFQNTTTCW